MLGFFPHLKFILNDINVPTHNASIGNKWRPCSARWLSTRFQVSWVTSSWHRDLSCLQWLTRTVHRQDTCRLLRSPLSHVQSLERLKRKSDDCHSCKAVYPGNTLGRYRYLPSSDTTLCQKLTSYHSFPKSDNISESKQATFCQFLLCQLWLGTQTLFSSNLSIIFNAF